MRKFRIVSLNLVNVNLIHRLLFAGSPFIFRDGIGLSSNTTSLLATGVVGIMEFVFTIPAVLWVDNFGRKSILIAGAIGMASCHFIVAGIIGAFHKDWAAHANAGWAGVVFIWIYCCNFGYSWGKFQYRYTRSKGIARFQGFLFGKQRLISFRSCCMDCRC